MFSVSRFSKSAPQIARLGQQVRNAGILSGPPTVKTSPAEKLFHGLFMCAGFLAIPTWVLVNIKHYREPSE